MAALTTLVPGWMLREPSCTLQAHSHNSQPLPQACAQTLPCLMSRKHSAVRALTLCVTPAGDAELIPHGVQLEVRRLTVAVESLIKQVDKDGKAQRDMAATVIAALTKLVCDIFPLLYSKRCTVDDCSDC